jgi:hypothetical protein
VPLLRAPGAQGGAVQGAEHEQQRAGGGFCERPGRNRQRAVLPGAGRRAVPDVRMNPLLLKPERDTHSQVVLMGQVDAELTAMPGVGAAQVWPQIAAALDANCAPRTTWW